MPRRQAENSAAAQRVNDALTLDPFHTATVGEVTSSDRTRADAGELSWVRAYVEHELDFPGEPFFDLPPFTVVVVAVIGGPNLRTQRPVVPAIGG